MSRGDPASHRAAVEPSPVPAKISPFPGHYRDDEYLGELPPLPIDDTPAARPSPPVGQQTALLPAPSSLVGRRIGNFVVERELGRGGFGAVYLARHVDADLALHQVIKVLHPELSHRPEIVERFRGEARAAAALSHPGIAHVEDFGQLATGEQYIVMEHLAGTDLASWLEAKGRLELSEALALLEQAADVLDAAHKRGIVHRDLKPSNLFRLADGRLKVLDFGIAKLMGDLASPDHRTATGIVMGTPHYMAPEQAIFGMARVTLLADVFALGVIAYELVTGVRPWSGTTIAEHVLEVTKRRPNPRALRRDLPAACANAIVAALDPLPACRPQAAGEFVRLLREGLAARRRSRRALYVALAIGGALLIATGVVLGGVLGVHDNDVTQAPAARPRTVADSHSLPSPLIIASDHPPAAKLPAPESPLPSAPTPEPTPAPPGTASPPAPPPTKEVPATAGAGDAAPRARAGGLRVSSTPDVADVFILGKFRCSTEPPCTLTLAAGQHGITLRNPRTSVEKMVWVTVPPGREARLDHRW